MKTVRITVDGRRTCHFMELFFIPAESIIGNFAEILKLAIFSKQVTK